uniref:Uncharacterized protein n=1 Tax=Timema poppense TaxID=170557 RepID=A0A7R9CP36_TIMPO|nr:unnamed protein product [Timema poppensis]
MFLDYSLQLLRKHRQLFLSHLRVATCRLDYLLRWKVPLLSQVHGSHVHDEGVLEVLPFQQRDQRRDHRLAEERHLGLVRTPSGPRSALDRCRYVGPQTMYFVSRVDQSTGTRITSCSTAEREGGYLNKYEEIHSLNQPVSRSQDAIIQGLVHLITLLLVDLQKGYDHYHPLFETAFIIADPSQLPARVRYGSKREKKTPIETESMSYSSPMTSLVLTDSSQLTSDSQHLGIYLNFDRQK